MSEYKANSEEVPASTTDNLNALQHDGNSLTAPNTSGTNGQLLVLSPEKCLAKINSPPKKRSLAVVAIR